MICQGRLVVTCIGLILLSACGSSHTGWNSFPVPIKVDSSLTTSTTFMSDFQDAMNFWEGKAGKKLFDYQGAYDTSTSTPYEGDISSPSSVTNNVVFKPTPWPFSSITLGQTMVTTTSSGIQAAMVMINSVVTFCTGDCTGQEGYLSEREVVAHELGHFLGLNHVPDPKDLMFASESPGGSDLTQFTIDEATFSSLVNGSN